MSRSVLNRLYHRPPPVTPPSRFLLPSRLPSLIPKQVDNIDFDEPLIDPGEKYKDLLYPAGGKGYEDGIGDDGAVVLTCDDNPNLEATALLKNSNTKVTATISSDGLRWVQHSVPIIPSGLKAQVAAETSSSLLKVRFEVSR